jgi:hypothetical protein
MRFHGREIEKVEKASSAEERERQRKENDNGKRTIVVKRK